VTGFPAAELLTRERSPGPTLGVDSNGGSFECQVSTALADARTSGETLGLIVFGLDPQWNPNDWLHRPLSKALVLALETKLRDLTLPTDSIGHLPGVGLALLCRHLTNGAEAERVARQLTETLSQRIELAGSFPVYPVLSAGVAVGSPLHRHGEELITDARAALYRAAECHSSVEVSDPKARLLILERFRLVNALGRALSDGLLGLEFQPIVSIVDRRVATAEALLRWPDGVVMAGSIQGVICTAEKTGWIRPLTQWVVDQAVGSARQLAAAFPNGHRPMVAVNLSPVELARPGFAEGLVSALSAGELGADGFGVEVTESVASSPQALVALTELRDHGLRISLDDFGTGYSSLGALWEMPIRTVKMDRTFIGRIDGDASARTILQAVVTMAHALGLEVVAEGVETREQLDVVTDLGCDAVQGYYLSRPMPLLLLTNWLRSRPHAKG
jgi:EAL domain-containing protein (putative c-di-GMP-specific phosphodiesterase class I)/GGDEF domain-containing protein